MPEGIRSRVRLFADDTIVYLTITSDTDAEYLQDLDKLAEWVGKWKMAFHPDKCNVLTIIRKKKTNSARIPPTWTYTWGCKSVKYLGCTISADLTWNDHIRNICNKANKTIGFLKRNLNINNSKIKETAYKSLVRPTVEYASSVWDPYHQNNKYRLEMVQRRAARYVTNSHHNTSSVSSMIEDLNWKSLEDRRKIAKLTMMYKLVNGLVLVNTEDRLIPPDRISRNNNTKAYQIPSCRTEIRKESYFPRTIRDWNALPDNCVTIGSLETFKAHLQDLF